MLGLILLASLLMGIVLGFALFSQGLFHGTLVGDIIRFILILAIITSGLLLYLRYGVIEGFANVGLVVTGTVLGRTFSRMLHAPE